MNVFSDISFFNIQNKESKITRNSFWYLDFLKTLDFFHSTGKNIQVVIIDQGNTYKNSICEKNDQRLKKLSNKERIELARLISQKNKNLSLCLMRKKLNLKDLINKYHTDITVGLIKQIAPDVQIKVIPIKNTNEKDCKVELYQALNKALKINPDILHFGLQVLDFDPQKKLDKKILQSLKKFKLVIAPSGNNGYIDKKVGFPANQDFVISIGSLCKKGEIYKISDFCQTKQKVDIFMPGEDLLSQIYIQELKDDYFIPVSGTSMACALATGSIACLIEKDLKLNNKIIRIPSKIAQKSLYA